MYTSFTPPKKEKTLSDLVCYLSKEDNILEKQHAKISKSKNQEIKQCVEYLSKEIDTNVGDDKFFTTSNDNVEPEIVKFRIENNCKGLSFDENRFFMANINPSKEELNHLKNGVDAFCDENNITSEKEKEVIFRQHLKEFSNDVMDQYAQNFGREGIESAKDLLWYGRVEKHRYWKHDSKEVIDNNKLFKQITALEKKGASSDIVNELRAKLHKDGDRVIYSNMPKEGDNHHVHIIISRRDIEQKMKLSPLSQYQSSENHIVKGTPCKAGFNRVEFAKRVEAAFDKRFDYVRPYEQTIDARLQFGKIKKEKTRISKAVNQLHVRDTKEINHFGVRNNHIIPEINLIVEAEKKKENLITKARISAIKHDTTNNIWARLNPDTIKPFFKTMEGFEVGDKLKKDKKEYKMSVYRNGLRVLPLGYNENWGVRQSCQLDNSVMNSYTQVLRSKDNFSLESVKYNIDKKIWEKENPNTPRPYYMTENGQRQLIEIKQGKRQGIDISAVQKGYYKDRDIYNQLNGIPKEHNYSLGNKDHVLSKATNYMGMMGKSVANNLFSEIHFNDVAKVVQLSYSILKAVHQTQKMAALEAKIKETRWNKNSSTLNVVQNNKTAEVIMQKPIAKTTTSKIKIGGNFSQKYAQNAAKKAVNKVGKGLATKALSCVNPVLMPVKIISLGVDLMKGLVPHDLER